MKILGIDTPNPLYNPLMPSFLNVFAMQSFNPLNYLYETFLPRSTPSLVLAKSSGWTKTVVAAPASPPLKTLISK